MRLHGAHSPPEKPTFREPPPGLGSLPAAVCLAAAAEALLGFVTLTPGFEEWHLPEPKYGKSAEHE